MKKPGFRFQYLYEENGATVTVRADKDSNLEVMEQTFQNFLLACGFHKSIEVSVTQPGVKE